MTLEVGDAVAAMKSEEKRVKIVGSWFAGVWGEIGSEAGLDFGPIFEISLTISIDMKSRRCVSDVQGEV